MPREVAGFSASTDEEKEILRKVRRLAADRGITFSKFVIDVLNRYVSENLIDKPEDSQEEPSDEGVGLRVQHPIVISPVERQAEPKSAELLRAEAELEIAKYKTKWLQQKAYQWDLIQQYGSEEEKGEWLEEYRRQLEEMDRPPESLYERVAKVYRPY